MQSFVITRQEAGGRFDKYLKRLLPQASSGFVYKMLRKKNITLNGKKAEGNEMLAEKDEVKLFFSEETYQKFAGISLMLEAEKLAEQGLGKRTISEAEQSKRDGGKKLQKISFAGERFEDCLRAFRELGEIPVVYEDEDILILNKPAGVLSQKAKSEDISLNEWMIGYLLEKEEVTKENLLRFRPSVCNRLDRNTSGLVLCGKSLRGSRFLSGALRDRRLCKYYLAYVQGKVESPITLCGYLKKEEETNRVEVLSEEEYVQRVKKYPAIEKEYHKIETVIEPLSYLEGKDRTKLEILLITGKSHQIRAHLSFIGHPVIGDKKYGWMPKGQGEKRFRHQLLHACRIEFPEIEGDFAYLSGKCFVAQEMR